MASPQLQTAIDAVKALLARSEGKSPQEMRVMFEEVDHMPPASVVLGMPEHGTAQARPRERHLENVADGGFRAVGHQDQPVGEIQRLVDIMRHHHHSRR